MSYTKRIYEDVMALDNALGEFTLKNMQEFFTDGEETDKELKKVYHQRIIDLWRATCDLDLDDEDWLCIAIMVWLAWEDRDKGCNIGKIAKHLRLDELEQKYMK